MTLAIIVPTVNRHQLLVDLARSIEHATEYEHAVYFVAEEDDIDTRLTLAGLPEHETVLGDFGSYAAAVNAGVKASTEPLLAIVNDDVIFHGGWDVAALSVMRDPIRVVGIDQGNGRTDCFFMVDRRYIDGDFYFEGYRSQYCDTEFAEVAKARGVWADAPGALIEHRHWTFGKSEIDVNYQKAIASTDGDRELYEQRRAAWAG